MCTRTWPAICQRHLKIGTWDPPWYRIDTFLGWPTGGGSWGFSTRRGLIQLDPYMITCKDHDVPPTVLLLLFHLLTQLQSGCLSQWQGVSQQPLLTFQKKSCWSIVQRIRGRIPGKLANSRSFMVVSWHLSCKPMVNDQ